MESVVNSSRKTAFVEGRNGQFCVGLNCSTRRFNHSRRHLILNRIRRRSKRLAGAGSGDEEAGAGRWRLWSFRAPAAAAARWARVGENFSGERPSIERGERIDAAVKRFIANARGLEPIANGMAAHEARANLLACKPYD
jgi:hypothetical protein